MGAAAAAPRRAPVTQPARKRTSPQRRSNPGRKRPNRALASSRPRRSVRIAQPALAGAARLPHAAVRTAGAVRDLSDSSLIVRLTQGRGWIGLLGALLFGIVALNVISLSLTAGNGRIGAEIDAVERHNSALRAELAEQLSASRVEAAAAELGLAVPDPRDINYLNASDENAEKLAKLLGTDEFLAGEPTGYTESTATDIYIPSVVAPASGASTSASASPAPSPTPAPAAPASSAPSSGGGTGGTGGVGL